MAAFGAHARQASVNEPGARLFSGFLVEIGHCAHDHEVKIEWAEVWRAWRPREELDVALLQKRLGAPAGV